VLTTRFAADNSNVKFPIVSGNDIVSTSTQYEVLVVFRLRSLVNSALINWNPVGGGLPFFLMNWGGTTGGGGANKFEVALQGGWQNNPTTTWTSLTDLCAVMFSFIGSATPGIWRIANLTSGALNVKETAVQNSSPVSSTLGGSIICGEQNGVADADINLVHTAAWKSRVLTDAEWLQVITDKSTYRLNQIVGAAMIHQVDWNAKVGGTTYDDLSPINSDSNSITGSAIDAVYDAPWTPGLGSPVDMVMKPGRPGLFDPDLNVEAWF
jgi:hypothetical protein